jgi:fatty acid desaturase
MLVANLLCGFSYDWWIDKHARHHAFPNRVGRDPDISHNVLVYAVEQAAAPQGVSRWIRRHQAILFLPLISLEALSVQVNSVRAVIRGVRRYAGPERWLLFTHLVLYGGLMSVLWPNLELLVWVILLHKCLLGIYLGLIFAANHKAMPIDREVDRRSYLRRQLETARNIEGGALVSAIYGGLNHQIEHHLFPILPRPALPAAARVVRAHCNAAGLDYESCSPVATYRSIFAHLYAVGRHR